MGNYKYDHDYDYDDYNGGNGNGGNGNGGNGNGGKGNGGNNGDPNVARLRWYVYIHGDPFVPNSYQSIPLRPLCSSGRMLCAINARGVRDRAFEFTPALKILIAQAIASGAPQPLDMQTPDVLMKP